MKTSSGTISTQFPALNGSIKIQEYFGKHKDINVSVM